MTQLNPDGVVRLSGSLGIDSAATIHTTLSEAMQRYDDIEIDIGAVEEMELPCLQLLCSMFAEARKTGKTVSLSGALASRVTKALVASGFVQSDESPPCSGEALASILRMHFERGGGYA